MQTKTSLTGNIKATVGLPLYNADRIYWLALESLCRQENINFEWELIIIEEKHERQVGIERIRPYVERLKRVGCVQVIYHELDEWINLTDKWIEAFSLTGETSKSFFLQAADCYSQPNRLRDSFDKIEQGYEWVDYTNGHFYNISTDQLVRYNGVCLTNLDMAFSTKNIYQVGRRMKNKGIDKHLFNSLRPIKKITLHKNYGIDTDGHNNISKKRIRFYDDISFPFDKADKQLSELVPIDIAERLKEL